MVEALKSRRLLFKLRKWDNSIYRDVFVLSARENATSILIEYHESIILVSEKIILLMALQSHMQESGVEFAIVKPSVQKRHILADTGVLEHIRVIPYAPENFETKVLPA